MKGKPGLQQQPQGWIELGQRHRADVPQGEIAPAEPMGQHQPENAGGQEWLASTRRGFPHISSDDREWDDQTAEV